MPQSSALPSNQQLRTPRPPAAPVARAAPDRAPTLWLTGLSGAGKSTLAQAVCASLARRGISTDLLDSDLLRPVISADLSFRAADRAEHARRLTARALATTLHGSVAVVCAVSPSRASRAETRRQLEPFVEVFVDAPIEVCEQRDPLGLYRRFRNRELHGLAGLDTPYEAPESPEVHCRTHRETIEESTGSIVSAVLARLVSASYRVA